MTGPKPFDRLIRDVIASNKPNAPLDCCDFDAMLTCEIDDVFSVTYKIADVVLVRKYGRPVKSGKFTINFRLSRNLDDALLTFCPCFVVVEDQPNVAEI